MRKTSVYLPEDLKSGLAGLAERVGCSEAEIIRAAIVREVSAGPERFSRPRPQRPGHLVGVGVGPGDPKLLTLAAVEALERAGRVVAPATSVDAVGRAELIVRQALPDISIERLPFEMAPDRQARDEAIEHAADWLVELLDGGEEIGFITLGDPLVYSTFPSVAQAVVRRRPATAIEYVSGVMAFQALAARTGTVLADERQAILIRTALAGDSLDADLRDPQVSVVAYKGGRRLPELSSAVSRAGRAGRAVAGELLGMAGERVGSLDALATGPASYLATVIVPATEGGS